MVRRLLESKGGTMASIHYRGRTYHSPYRDGPSRFEEKDFMDAVDASQRYSEPAKKTKKKKKKADKTNPKRSRMKKTD